MQALPNLALQVPEGSYFSAPQSLPERGQKAVLAWFHFQIRRRSLSRSLTLAPSPCGARGADRIASAFGGWLVAGAVRGDAAPQRVDDALGELVEWWHLAGDDEVQQNRPAQQL